jgi:hypothetical protein
MQFLQLGFIMLIIAKQWDDCWGYHLVMTIFGGALICAALAGLFDSLQ